ncbi:MAG TPA: hypothetical protein VNQ90_17065 [Chthoniobacteraceae bacterium]|nr:hypothetical protein [Chthoniobacteraceae bacterium]
MEKDAALVVKVTNRGGGPLLKAVLQTEGGAASAPSLPVPELAPGAAAELRLPLDTTLRPGIYRWEVRLLEQNGSALGRSLPVRATLVARRLPHTMPVILWNSGERLSKEMISIGFTHRFSINVETPMRPDDERVIASRIALDELFAAGLRGIAKVSPGKDAELKAEFQRVDRTGRPFPRKDVDGLLPGVVERFEKVGRDVAAAYGDLPALDGVLINPEIRSMGTQPSFHKADLEAYRKATGRSVPEAVGKARGVSFARLPGFPASRVIADDDPILTYYRWFWREGDGWNRLNTELAKAVRAGSHPGLWTWFAPAVRAPSLYGSGGKVDALAQWTYTYPDPIKIDYATFQTLAMAKGALGQEVFGGTQIIWYRHRTAPQESATAAGAPWETEMPDARFITIAPDHLSEALWLQLAAPVKGLLYHGWGSLVPTGHRKYRMTNPETAERLTDLLRRVVRPLGPVLMQLPGRATDVAFLESFASQMFAGRGSYGWGRNWGADSWQIARHAGLEPEVLYAEALKGADLERYRVLFATDCDVITESTLQALQAFQARGGIVVGDENLPLALVPDIVLRRSQRSGRADRDKEALLKAAAALRLELAPYYRHLSASDNPQIFLRERHYGNARYLFAVNDHRRFGTYVGQHRFVMEEGLASEGKLTLQGRGRVVYDLLEQRAVPVRPEGDLGVEFEVRLGAGEGKLYLVLEEAVGAVRVAAREQARLGERFSCTIDLAAASGKPLEAVAPVEVTLLDPKGRKAEGSGFHAIRDGRLEVGFDLALNDTPGRWSLQVREGISGQMVERTVEVAGRD